MNQITIATITRRSGSDAQLYGSHHVKIERFAPFVGRISWYAGDFDNAETAQAVCAEAGADEIVYA